MKNPLQSDRTIVESVFIVFQILALIIIYNVWFVNEACAFISGGMVDSGGKFFAFIPEGDIVRKTKVGGNWVMLAEATANAETDNPPRKEGVKPKSDSILAKASDALAFATAVGVVSFWGPEKHLLVTSLGSFAFATAVIGAADAVYSIRDPAVFTSEGSGLTELLGSYGLESGFGLSANGDASSHYFFSATSNQTGYEKLFSLDIRMDGRGIASLVTDFQSNPLFNLSDSIIENLIQSSLIKGNGFLEAELPDIFHFTVPDVVIGKDLVLDITWSGSVVVAPEPSTLFFLTCPLAAFAFRRFKSRMHPGRN